MTATDSLPESVDVPNRAVGYTKPSRRRDWGAEHGHAPLAGHRAGGGYSTVGDLLRFAEALGVRELISKATLADATPQRQQYGYGFGVQGEGPLRSYGHGGGAPGMNGELRISPPKLGYVVVGLSNLDPPAAPGLVEYFALRMPDQ